MDAFETIASMNTPEEANVAISFLIANGIDARLRNEQFSPAIGSGLGFGGYKIIVPTAQALRAKGFLKNPTV